MAQKRSGGERLRSIGAGVFAAFIVVWGLALLSVEPVYTVGAVTAAGATFIGCARFEARQHARQHAAAIAARADAAPT